jgi:pyruvate/2-oxoglutarate dehydrogenase complex dihydrolipoamide acyltransferase (E2) component
MSKFVTRTIDLLFVSLLALVLVIPQDVFAQNQDHVVSSADLQRDVSAASAARQQNLAQVENFLASPEARQALKSAHIDYAQVNDAVPQLSDQDLARLSKMAANAQKDFAAGDISNRDLLWILVAVAALILIIVAVR